MTWCDSLQAFSFQPKRKKSSRPVAAQRKQKLLNSSKTLSHLLGRTTSRHVAVAKKKRSSKGSRSPLSCFKKQMSIFQSTQLLFFQCCLLELLKVYSSCRIMLKTHM